MVDIYLWPLPSDANPNDVRLRDPTTFTPPSPGTVFVFTQIIDDD